MHEIKAGYICSNIGILEYKLEYLFLFKLICTYIRITRTMPSIIHIVIYHIAMCLRSY